MVFLACDANISPKSISPGCRRKPVALPGVSLMRRHGCEKLFSFLTAAFKAVETNE